MNPEEPIELSAASEAISESSDSTFVADVLEESKKQPVIVDFWAPWCGPCKQLAPALEKAVRDARGKVRLAKINVDENPLVAGQLRVQSIPAVFAFVDGKPVDGFVGAQTASQIENFVKSVVGKGPAGETDQIAEALERAESALAAGGAAEAARLYGAILQREPANPKAVSGFVRCYIRTGDLTRAQQILDAAPSEIAEDSAISAARTALELARSASAAGDSNTHRNKLSGDPNDHQARSDLAMALLAEGDKIGAVNEYLEIFRRNRNWNEGAAQVQMLKLFETFGESDPATIEGRRRLSSLLFA